MDNRAEIREFLVTGRAKITPEQVGLPLAPACAALVFGVAVAERGAGVEFLDPVDALAAGVGHTDQDGVDDLGAPGVSRVRANAAISATWMLSAHQVSRAGDHRGCPGP